MAMMIRSEFIDDVYHGFSKPEKSIQSKYFYDELGSEIFNKITRHPDYYLTQCEIEILKTYKESLANLFSHEEFNLVELGPGEGIKTTILIDECLRKSANFIYMPIDISKRYLDSLMVELSLKINKQQLIPLCCDYFSGLQWLKNHSKKRNLVLFLGSSIGNFTLNETLDFTKRLRNSINQNDYVLMGFDLRKHTDILMRAYNDSNGYTREFNINLLRRMNQELNADFFLEKFQHYPTYNVHSGAMESYLISLEAQDVHIGKSQKLFHLAEMEPIHVEFSQKFYAEQIDELANKSGFEVVQHFRDSKKYFIDSLWRAK